MLFIKNNAWACEYILHVHEHMFCKCVSLCVTLYSCCLCTKQACVWTTLWQCVYSRALKSYPIPQRIKSCLVYNLLYFTSLRSHVICSCQPTYLLITPCVFCPLFSHWLKGAEVGLSGQYKEGGSLHQSLVGGYGMKSQHSLHQQVRCACCFIIHQKLTVLH